MKTFPEYCDRNRLGGRHGFKALEWRNRLLFEGIDLRGQEVLEIGAGDGLLSLWLLHAGARLVVSLEPEADGATTGVAKAAERFRTDLCVPGSRWEYRAETFQSYKPDRKFGVIVSHASINHMDEEACVRLRDDMGARERYLELFRKIKRSLARRGSFMFADCGRVNYWRYLLRRQPPWSPSIEWHKHQEPETWCDLLCETGLNPVRVRWSHHFYRLRGLGSLLTTRTAARCLTSTYSVVARKD
jgi:SAM-dependent methyltransferase